MRWRLLVLAVAILAAACASPAEETSRTPVAPAGDRVDFTAETVGGGEIDMSDYADAPLALWFWSPW